MSVLAIDPGTTQSGYVLLDEGYSLESFGVELNDDILARIAITTLTVDSLAIEMIASYGMPVGREVFETCVWIGRFIEAFDDVPTHHESHQLVYRSDVKQHLCGSSRAKDANIRQVLIDRYGPGKDKAVGRKANPGPLYGVKSHVWAALAVGVTYLDWKKEGTV